MTIWGLEPKATGKNRRVTDTHITALLLQTPYCNFHHLKKKETRNSDYSSEVCFPIAYLIALLYTSNLEMSTCTRFQMAESNSSVVITVKPNVTEKNCTLFQHLTQLITSRAARRASVNPTSQFSACHLY